MGLESFKPQSGVQVDGNNVEHVTVKPIAIVRPEGTYTQPVLPPKDGKLLDGKAMFGERKHGFGAPPGVPRGAMPVAMAGQAEEPKAVTPPAPPAPPAVICLPQVALPQPDDEKKILERMGKLLKIETLNKELEEENKTLAKMVVRLQAEIDALKAK
jgi:hypothetical protein